MSPTENIIIKSGNPFGKNATPASYTRFILPFKYSGKISEFKQGKLWTDIKPDKNSEEREKYFTNETSQVLFHQAKYFEFNHDDLLHFDYLDKTISLNSPKIALFEAELGSKESLLKTGFLILEIYFKEEQEISLELLLEINELFRYKTEPYKGHSNQLSQNFNQHLAQFLLKEKDSTPVKYGHWQRLLDSFFGDSFGKGWDIYADSRAFVWTCVVTKKREKDLVEKDLVEKFYPDSSDKWQAQNYGHWIKLLNVDKSREDRDRLAGQEFNSQSVHSSTEFEREWADKKTYKRWEELGSFYGFSYHCGAAFIPPSTDPGYWQHFGQMYFDMYLLLLYTRVTVFRFSNKLTEISIEATKKDDVEANILNWRKSFESLRWEFTLFTNLYQFPLISNQQQMIEMYAIARESLDIEDLYNEVKEEIHNNQEYILQQVQQKQSESSLTLAEQSTALAATSLKLTRLATIGLVVGMALTMLSTRISDSLGSLVNNLIIPNKFRLENGLSVDWFLIVIYMIFFFLFLKILVWVWEKFFGGEN